MRPFENGDVALSAEPITHGWQSLGAVTGHRLDPGSLIVECGTALLRITPIHAGIIRIQLAPSGHFGRDHSWAVIDDDLPRPVFQFEEDDERITLTTDELQIHIRRNPCRLSFHNLNGDTLAEEDPNKGMSWVGEEVRSWIRLECKDHFFGLGERGCPLDKRGMVVLNWNRDAAEHEPWSDPLYQSHPFLLVFNPDRTYGLFFDNSYRASFDLGKTSADAYSFGAEAGEMNYYFIAGSTPADIVRRYAGLVGTPHLPPLWSLGYQQCRFSYESARRVRQIAKRLREHRIPCDTIYLDIDYMDGFRCFTWNAKRFPKPGRLMKELAKGGFRTIAIIDPGIKTEPGYPAYDEGIAGDHFCHNGDGQPYVGRVWPGETMFPDFTRPQTRRWWGGLYHGLTNDGVTGFWNDMNEPSDFSQPDGIVPLSLRHDNEGLPTDHRGIHNIYGMQMARATFEGLRRLRPDERPFVLTRAGYSGVQRYAAVWTGDNLSSWEHLRMSLPMLLNMSLSGIAFCGADIGGFRGIASAELFTRWLQLGIFYPLCRTHTVGGAEQDPTAYGTKYEAVNRRAIELRYRLLPYLYTLFHEASHSGVPPLRPLFLEYPDLPDGHLCQHEFMFGSQIFVAPVMHEQATTRRVRLPVGTWYDFQDATPRTGGETFDLAVKLSSIPMFVRNGAILPMRQPVQFTDEKPLEELILTIFPGSGRGSFYNDDGISYAYSNGAYILEEYEVQAERARTTFQLVKRSGSETFIPPSYHLRFNGIDKAPRSISVSNETIPRKMSRQAFSRASTGWWFDASGKRVLLRLPHLTPSEPIVLHYIRGNK